MAISPGADAAASDAVNPLGQPIAVGGFSPWSKNMPRRNIPAKARVAWNVAFRQILLARAAADSLTEYTRRMGELVQRTEKVFRSFTEKWIRSKSISNADPLATEINEIIGASNALAYAAPEKPSPAMITPAQGRGADDTLGALLIGTLNNLLRRLSKVPGEEGAKPAAIFAGSLAAQAQESQQSNIWRTMSSPPLSELGALADRLADIACILHEMAHDHSPGAMQRIVKVAKNGSFGKAVRAAARHCRTLADQRFQDRLRGLERALTKQGLSARCLSRPIEQSDSVSWPAREVTVLVEVADLGTHARYVVDGLAIGQQHLGTDWQFRVVPVINGQVVASLALLPSSSVPLPDQNFAKEWRAHISQPFLSSEISGSFDAAIAACTQVSAIVASRDLESLHPEEEEVLSKAIDYFTRNRNLVAAAAEKTGSDDFIWAVGYLDQTWGQVVGEFESKKAGQSVDKSFCMTAHLALAGQENEHATELAAARILLLQAECGGLAAGSPSQVSGVQ